jgi:hypothetical protein
LRFANQHQSRMEAYIMRRAIRTPSTGGTA